MASTVVRIMHGFLRCPSEWILLSDKQKCQVYGCNDHIQLCFGELKQVVYPAVVLADETIPVEEQCKVAREFYHLQCLLLFDEIATTCHCRKD